ncbi:MAG: RuvX/YqgF family protein, partial [Acidobacteriota bacterium]|nr:RuvX/YqgF family protein [Acidobacteriota bacterium]
MQHTKMPNTPDFTDIKFVPKTGRLVAIDPGTRRIGVAISDRLQKTVSRLKTVKRTSWKKLLVE